MFENIWALDWFKLIDKHIIARITRLQAIQTTCVGIKELKLTMLTN